jgi:hypothetical protein
MAEEVASDALDALTRLMELVPRQDRPRVTDMLELLARLVDDKRL